MLEILVIVALCGLIFALAKRVVQKRRGKATTARVATGIEGWIASEVAGIVAKKVALGRSEVERSMTGAPEAEVVSAVERVVSRVEVVYERLAAGQLEVRAEVHFEDGSHQRATKMVGWSELPEGVREELKRSGAAQVHKNWSMPWAS
jgi:hypothetical protein